MSEEAIDFKKVQNFENKEIIIIHNRKDYHTQKERELIVQDLTRRSTCIRAKHISDI